MSKGKEPTPKQKAFADEFLKCGNQTEVAKRAGYSEKTARQAGAENMKNLSFWNIYRNDRNK